MPAQSTLKSPRLSRESWLVEASRMLVEGGVDMIQITELSRRLKITRGSFYWHFENRDDLLSGLVEMWRERNTGVMVGALADARSLDDGLLALFDVWVDRDQFDPALDLAVRGWGRTSDDVLVAITAEDENRVQAIAAFLTRFQFEQREAFIRARVIYFTQLSYYALGISEPFETRLGYLDAYFRCFIGRDADPSAKLAFETRYMTAAQ